MKPTKLLLLAFLCLAVAACGMGKSSPLPSEIPTAPGSDEINQISVDTPQEELLVKAKKLYSVGLYTGAREAFEALRDGYPFGPYAEYAEIKIADCNFYVREYSSAALLYEEFTKNHPASTSLAYALLQAGRSNQLTNSAVGRDNAPLEKALVFYQDLLKRYPNSLYAESARRGIGEVEVALAEYERMVMSFYQHQEKQAAYEARRVAFEERWGNRWGTLVAAAEDQGTEPQQMAMLDPEALPNTPSVLGAERPGQAAKLQLANIESPSMMAAWRDDSQPVANTATTLSSGNRLLKLDCETGGTESGAMLYFDRPVAEEDLSTSEAAGQSVLKIGGAQIAGEVRECAGHKISLSNDGQVTFDTPQIEAITLNNPARVLVVFGG